MTSDARQFVDQAERDGQIADAVHRALYAMNLYHDRLILLEGEQERLDFTAEMDKLREALRLLGVDPGEVLPAPGSHK